MTTIQELRAFNLFQGLDDGELDKFIPLCHERTLKKGAIPCLQGTQAYDLHLCRNGKVDIVIKHFEAPTIFVKIHSTQRGEAFGWSALVKPFQYTASAVCAENTEEIYMGRTELFYLFDQFPRIGYIFMKNLSVLVSSRLTEYTKRLSKDIALEEREDYEW